MTLKDSIHFSTFSSHLSPNFNIFPWKNLAIPSEGQLVLSYSPADVDLCEMSAIQLKKHSALSHDHFNVCVFFEQHFKLRSRSCLKLVFIRGNQITRQAPVMASRIHPYPTVSWEARSQEEKH